MRSQKPTKQKTLKYGEMAPEDSVTEVECRGDAGKFFSVWPTAYWEVKGNEKKTISVTTAPAEFSFIRL